MIIECPNCETRYEAPVAFPPEGRKVRCAKCLHIWTATAEPAAATADFEDEEIIFKESAVEAAEPAVEPEPEAEPEAVAEAETGTAAEADLDLPIDEALSIDAVEESEDAAAEDARVEDAEAHPEEGAETLHADEAEEAHGDADGEWAAPAEEDAQAEEAGPGEEEAGAEDAAFPEDGGAGEEDEAEQAPIVIGKAQRRIAAPGPLAAGWGLLALLVIGLAGFVYFQRVEVVRALPGTAWLYERAGLPVNVRGLDFENVRYSWEAEGGRAILQVRGEIVNVSGETRKVPTVVLGLRAEDDVEVYQWAQEVRAEPLAPDGRANFLARIPTPPNSIRGVQARFARVR